MILIILSLRIDHTFEYLYFNEFMVRRQKHPGIKAQNLGAMDVWTQALPFTLTLGVFSNLAEPVFVHLLNGYSNGW